MNEPSFILPKSCIIGVNGEQYDCGCDNPLCLKGESQTHIKMYTTSQEAQEDGWVYDSKNKQFFCSKECEDNVSLMRG